MTTPIILFSDHPAAPTGLARITRDFATMIHHHLRDEFRVATLGYGHPGSSKLKFPQYQWRERADFLPLELPSIWSEFCGDDAGILLTIGDIQRFLELSDPALCRDKPFSRWMEQMRGLGKLKLWGYFPLDAHSVGCKLGPELGHTLSHYDRRLVPSDWAREIIKKTLPNHSCDVIPHGIDTDIFYPRPTDEHLGDFFGATRSCRRWPQQDKGAWQVGDALKIGIVATNQPRKDWGLAIEIVAELKKTRPVFLWAHTDRQKTEQGWAMMELLSDFNLLGSSVLTIGNMSDEQMAICYSAMDLTLGIGRGEGWGYPMAESMACGTPVLTGDYGAQIDYVPTLMQIPAKYLRIEGPLNLYRPVHDPKEWARAAIEWEGQRYSYSVLPKEFEWKAVWPRFVSWLREGVR